MGGIFKYLLAGLFAFASYNEFVMMHRDSAFGELASHSDKAAVENAVGESQFSFHCGANEQPLTFLPYIDSLCKDKVEEVGAYALCRIPMRCHGWYYVGFDHNGKLMNKYKLNN